MGTHPIFESDFDCLTDLHTNIYGRFEEVSSWNKLLRVRITTGEDMSDVQVQPNVPVEQLATTTTTNNTTKVMGESLNNILTRKRKISESSDQPQKESDEVVQSLPRKKLKWETIIRAKTGLNLEHALYFAKDETKHYFTQLEKEIEYLSNSASSVVVYGKEYNWPRMVAVYGDPGVKITFAKRTLGTTPWTPILLKIKKEVENIKNTKYNLVMVNKYVNGSHNMGFHADDEDEIDQSVPICSVSLGASRDFTFLPKRNNDDKLTIPLHDGTVLFMNEPTQKCWKHAIPKRLKVKTARINLTFRKIITEDEDNEAEKEGEEKEEAKEEETENENQEP